MVVGALTHSFTHTHTQAHAQPYKRFLVLLLQTCIYSVRHSLESSCHSSFLSSNSLTGSHQFSSETNKCVTCQQSIIGPYDPLRRPLYPFVHSAVFLSSPSCFPFIRRLSTHSLVQSVVPTLVASVWSSCNPVLDSVKLVQNRRCEGLEVFVVGGIKAFVEPGSLAALQVSCQYFCPVNGSRPGPALDW